MTTCTPIPKHLSPYQIDMGIIPLGQHVLLVGALSHPAGALPAADTIRMCASLIDMSDSDDVKFACLADSNWEPVDLDGRSLASGRLMDLTTQPVWRKDTMQGQDGLVGATAILKTHNLLGEDGTQIERKIFVSVMDFPAHLFFVDHQGATYRGELARVTDKGLLFSMARSCNSMPKPRFIGGTYPMQLLDGMTFRANGQPYKILSDRPLFHQYLIWESIAQVGSTGLTHVDSIMDDLQAKGVNVTELSSQILMKWAAMAERTELLRASFYRHLTTVEHQTLTFLENKMLSGAST